VLVAVGFILASRAASSDHSSPEDLEATRLDKRLGSIVSSRLEYSISSKPWGGVEDLELLS